MRYSYKIVLLVLLISGLQFGHNVQAQYLKIEYQKPFSYIQSGTGVLSPAIIFYPANLGSVTVLIDGIPVTTKRISDTALSLNLPLIGDLITVSLHKNDKELTSQLFHPVIPANWGYFANGTIDIINSTHQDIAWENTPDSCRYDRIHNIILPSLEIMKEDPNFKFGMEQTLNLRELIDEYPALKDTVISVYKKHQFTWGATFNQPYEGMLSHEQLARQLYLGRKWIHEITDEEMDTRTAFNMDVPGRAFQFPQILSKAGIRYLVVSRMKEGFFKWYSPDGSNILVYSPGNYGWPLMIYKYFDEDAPTAMNKLYKVLENWQQYYLGKKIPPHYPVYFSTDASRPAYYRELLEEWNKIADISPVPIPRLRYSTAEDLMSSVDQPGARFDSISGERPNLWLYIHGPAHYEAIKAKRSAGIHLPAAEVFSSIALLLDSQNFHYPSAALDSAWYKAIYDDHGWGGNHGEVTDSVFNTYLHQADNSARVIIQKSIESISNQITITKNKTIVVFNDLIRKRNGIVTINLPGQYKNISISDHSGNVLLSQIKYSRDSTLLSFEVLQIPSLGYSTFYLSSQQAQPKTNHEAKSNFCENGFYKIELGQGGIVSLYDKELDREVFNTTRYAAGDILDLGYDGNGAGEFNEITPTNMRDFDKLSNYFTPWVIKENGPLYTVYQAEMKLNGEKIIQSIKIYHTEKKIDFNYDIPEWKGRRNRQLRFALPLNINSKDQEIDYEVPFGISTVDRSELDMMPGGWSWEGTYRQRSAEIRPREMQNFVTVSDKKAGISMSSSVSVFDWIDPVRDAVNYPVLQGIMLSTHKSVHGKGNWYLQKGEHSFTFSITSHAPGWKNGFKFGLENSHPLYTVFKPNKNKKGHLPAEESFMSISDPYTLVTTFKRSEDGFIIRLAEMEGKNKNLKLNIFKTVSSIGELNLIEEKNNTSDFFPNEEGEILLNIPHHSIKTFEIKP